MTISRPRPYRHATPADIDGRLATNYQEQAELRARLAQLKAHAAPLEAEYAERGGWTRAFLVENANGHVHRSQGCSTCFATTEFSWLTDYSGADEDEIVTAAAEKACTTCFSSAPTDILKRPSKFQTRDEAAAAQRTAERADKAAAKAAKMLMDPATGEPLRGAYGPFKTERGAELEAVSGLSSLLFYGSDHPTAGTWIDVARRVAAAKAAKHATAVADEFATLRTKGENSYKRETGQGKSLSWLEHS